MIKFDRYRSKKTGFQSGWWERVNDETQEHFDIWENFDKNPASADEVQLDASQDIDNIIDNTRVPWVRIHDINVPWGDIKREAYHLMETECFTDHRASGSGGWMSLCMHGMSSVHTNCPEDYNMPDRAERDLSGWTDISKFAPLTKEWMQDEMLYDKFTRVRFMLLLPGGYIAPHADVDRIPGLGATNVAINNPDKCNLVMEEYGTMPFEPGTVFKINTGYRHAVWNRSDEPRVHMIFDGDQGVEFKKKVNENYAKMFNV